MSALYVTAQGDNRKGVTQRGHRALTTHARGWLKGARVDLESRKDTSTKEDAVTLEVTLTGGSSGHAGGDLPVLRVDRDNKLTYLATEKDIRSYLEELDK